MVVQWCVAWYIRVRRVWVKVYNCVVRETVDDSSRKSRVDYE